MKKKLPVALGIVAIAGLGIATPSSAKPSAKAGQTHAEWSSDCSVVVASSTKDISNVVFMIDGVEHRIEFEDGTHELELPGEITDLWIKAGNNKSGHGPGYGQHYAQPTGCEIDTDVNY